MIADLISAWPYWVPGIVLFIAGIVSFFWLYRMNKRVEDHAERISYIEGRLHASDTRDDEPRSEI
jgi:hypothetical protein